MTAPQATSAHIELISLGAILLAALALEAIGRRTRLPRVTLLILFGLAIGPSALDLLPHAAALWYPTIADVALMMVAFLLGGTLTREELSAHGRQILLVSFAVSGISALLVGACLALGGVNLAVALPLAGIAIATAPAATMEVVRQTGAKGPFTELVVGVVAVDDVWSIVIFSLLLGAALAFVGADLFSALSHGAWDLFGALAVGALVGFPAAALTGRIEEGEPTLIEALGVIFLCGGISLALGVSYLLAGITAGAIVANFAKHHTRPFHEIENIETPLLAIFFVLAGATFVMPELGGITVAVTIFVVARFVGRIAGGVVGARLAGLKGQGGLIGIALTPQAGVSVGMALVASHELPQYGETILAITLMSTVVFELVGPLLTTRALRVAGEVR